MIVLLDLSEVIITGLLGVEDVISEKYDFPADDIYTGLHTLAFNQLLIGETDEDSYLSASVSKLEELGLKISSEELKQMIRNNFSLVEGADKGLQILDRNSEKMILITNHSKEWYFDISQRFSKFLDYFDQVYNSADHGMAKPDPEFFRFVINSEQVRIDELLFIDDSKENIAAARKLDIKSILFVGWEDCITKFKDIAAAG